MTVRTVLRMGDARLLQPAVPVAAFATPELAALIADLFDTMAAEGGVGIAAPQIGVGLRVVIFGFEHSERYPDAPPVPMTVLINPVITPLVNEKENKNFYDYINTLRAREFISIVANAGNQKYTLLGLAYDCGFNSKSSFNRNFKKITRQTPTEFLNTNSITGVS